MKSVWGIIIFSTVFSVAGLFMIFKGQVEVDPLRVLNPTNFSSKAEIGAVMFRRFFADIKPEKLVVLASSPYVTGYEDIWSGFLKVAREYNVEFGEIYVQEGLGALGFEFVSSGSSSPVKKLDWEKVQIALAGDHRVLVHLVADDKMWREVQERTRKGMVLFQSLLPVTEKSQALLKSSCDPQKPDEFQIACKALQALQHGKRKKFDAGKIAATIEKHGKREYVLFVHEPVPE